MRGVEIGGRNINYSGMITVLEEDGITLAGTSGCFRERYKPKKPTYKNLKDIILTTLITPCVVIRKSENILNKTETEVN